MTVRPKPIEELREKLQYLKFDIFMKDHDECDQNVCGDKIIEGIIKNVESYILHRENQVKKEIVKNLIIIRDVELKDTPLPKNRVAYNINLLIEELSKEEL